MGQRLLEDKITTLSESGGTITLAAGARLTIGGQQYTTSSALNVAANLSTAVGRYQIYAVLSGGVPILVVSSNENSIGPAGYTSWKLVGSYMTNGASSIAFGSFLNITDSPESKSMSFTISGSNFGTLTSQGTTFYRKGSKMYVEARFATGTHSAASAQIDLPGLKTIGAPTGQQVCGFCISQSGPIYSSPVLSTGTTHFLFGNGEASGGQLSTANATGWSNSNLISFFAEVEISGWSNIAIKDL